MNVNRVVYVQASNEYIMYVCMYHVSIMNASEMYHTSNILQERP